MGWLIALAIVLGLALLVTLVILLPVGVRIDYNADGLKAWYKIGPFRIIWYPEKEKKQKKKDKNKVTLSRIINESANDKPQKGGAVQEFLSELGNVLKFYWSLRRKIRLKRLELKLILAGGDPCDLALNYGRAWAAVGNLFPLLEETFIIKKRDVEVECDFTASETLIVARLDIVLPLGRFIAHMVNYCLDLMRE